MKGNIEQLDSVARGNIKRLKAIARKHGFRVSMVAGHVILDPRFLTWSGSSKPQQHHYGKGGLLQHTTEVVELCLDAARRYAEHDINPRALFLAALFHDCGKMWDYEPHPDNGNQIGEWKGVRDDWGGSPHKRLIHHVSRSAIEWSLAVEKDGVLKKELGDDVLHAILSHHGSRQTGSPVAPKTRVAWLVHLCDGMSARMYDADTWDIVKGRVKEGEA